MRKENIKVKTFEKEQIIKYFYTKNFGETITFDELQQFTHYNLVDQYESLSFKTNVMRKVKNELIENGYVLKSIRNIGYYILKPNQIQSYTYRTYIIRPLKNLEKAEVILNNTRRSNLNEEELKKHKLTQNLNKELKDSTSTLINSQKYNKLKYE